MSKSEQHRAKRRRKGPSNPPALEPSASRTNWDELETSLRGLRNLNAMQLQLIGHVERIGKALRRERQ